MKLQIESTLKTFNIFSTNLQYYFITFFIFFIGDYILYKLINYIFFLKNNNSNLISIKEWLIGNSVSYFILTYLYWGILGNTYYNYNISFYGLDWRIYILLTIICNIFLMDTFFYFLHRIAHISIVYDSIHYHHHKFRPITSWISRVSHWLDSNIENIAFTMPFIIIPTYCPIIWIILLFTFYWGCLIHDNGIKFEKKYINCPYTHNIHHKYGKKSYNYSYYFTHWDRIFKTYKKI